jgi:pyruvate carboxylase
MADSEVPHATDIQTDITFNDVFEDDDEEELKETPTVHHIRANSSIMQVKKILGMYLAPATFPRRQLAPN